MLRLLRCYYEASSTPNAMRQRVHIVYIDRTLVFSGRGLTV